MEEAEGRGDDGGGDGYHRGLAEGRSDMTFDGKAVLITGGSRGIGAGISRGFSACGAGVAFTSPNSEAEAAFVLGGLYAIGGNHLALKADAKDETEMQQAVATIVNKLGTIGLLVANVATSQFNSVAELSIEDWNNGILTNLSSTYIAIKLAYPYLKTAERGDIIMIGSSAAYDGGGGAAYYSTSKAGMNGLMKFLVRELSPTVRVNTIHPCLVATKTLLAAHKTEQRIAELTSKIPLGRMSKTSDIANLAAFLCSPLGEFITGQAILVDGGRTMWKWSE